MRKNIYLIRHGESHYNAKKIVQGHIDTELTDRGFIQAKYAAEFLKSKNITKIISSDLKRALQTAETISKVLNISVEVDKRIREMHFGSWEGMSYDYIYQNHMEYFHKWLANPVKHPLPKQEDITQFENRLSSFLEDIRNHNEENILVVGHGGSIQGLICVAMGLGMENLWKFKHNNTGISLIESIGKLLNVRFINMSYHLEKLEENIIVML